MFLNVLSFGARSFSVSATKLWNSLLLSLRTADVLIPFVVTSRPTTASRPSNPLYSFFLAPQIRVFADHYLFIYLAFANTDNQNQYIVRTSDCTTTRQNSCTYESTSPLYQALI